MKKNKYLPIYVFIAWWLFWLIIHNTELSPIYKASISTQIYFLSMVFFVTFSYLVVINSNINIKRNVKLKYFLNNGGKIFIIFSLILFFIILIYTSFHSGVFRMSVAEYFLNVRGKEGLGSTLSGNKYVDIFTVFIIVPFLYFMIFISFVLEKEKFNLIINKIVFLLIVFFTYTYQTSYLISFYIIIQLINLFFFKRDDNGKLLRKAKLSLLLFIVFAIFILFLMGSFRYGSFSLFGIIEKYIISYYTLGFYIFDVKINQDNILLANSYTYGRSFLGWFDSMFDLIIRFIDKDFYKAANLENLDFNAIPVEAGIMEGKILEYNAFSTILFTMFRDFSFAGVAIYSFIFGISLAYVYLYNYKFEYKMIFLLFIYSSLISVQMSQVERPYFWFVFLFTFIFKYLFIIKK